MFAAFPSASLRLHNSLIPGKRPSVRVLQFIARTLDREYYLSANADVAAAGVDPVLHWLDHGAKEERPIAAGLFTRMVSSGGLLPDPEVIHTLPWRAGQWVQIGRISSNLPIRAQDLTPVRPEADTVRPATDTADEDRRFVDWIGSHFEADAYRETNKDVIGSDHALLAHYLNHGIFEGRRPSPGVTVRYGNYTGDERGGSWQKFTYRGRPLAASLVAPPEDVVQQIRRQWRHESAVLASGYTAFASVNAYDAVDLWSRSGLKFDRVTKAFPRVPQAVVLLEFLGVGGAEKYGIDIADVLVAAGYDDVIVVVTGQREVDAGNWEDYSIFSPLRSIPVVFWRDLTDDNEDRLDAFARLLSSFRAKDILVFNSRLGLEAVARYGRGMATVSRIYCAFFSMGLPGRGVPYGEIFPQKVALSSRLLTDNARMAAALKDRVAALDGPGIHVVPPRIGTVDEATFLGRLRRRCHRARTLPDRVRRWAWVSRVEPLKGTHLLAQIAQMRPHDRFDVYGPLQVDMDAAGLNIPNVDYRGVLESVLTANFEGYDGFVFTSLTEGMPNTVLEMSQHAIPLILTDVGGLRDTFSKNSAFLIDPPREGRDAASEFDAALSTVAALCGDALAAMLMDAKAAVSARHAPEVFQSLVEEMLGK